jgi:hypothetical protein
MPFQSVAPDGKSSPIVRGWQRTRHLTAESGADQMHIETLRVAASLRAAP